MIPIRLTLKNFMSYGEQETSLPFEGLHVACLSGDNGNGKSALLDAMTYALWGKTRASSVRGITEDDLIRAGADDMFVRFEFALNEERYRVVKKRKRGKSSGSEWQLAQKDAAGQYVPIGGNSQRETGREIIRLLSMEYETFINSAYLQQGRADEFTRQTPDSRKRILGEILGLERYDRLEAKARERHRELKALADELDGEIRLLDAEASQRPEYERKLAETRLNLTAAIERMVAQEQVAAQLRDQRSKLDALAQTVADTEAAYRRLASDLQQREAERCEKIARLDALQKTLDQREAITNDYRVLQSARSRREKLEPELELFNKASRDLATVIGAIDIERTKLLGELRTQESRLALLEQRVQECRQIDARLVELEQALLEEPQVAAALQALTLEQEQAQQRLSDLSARNKQLEAELVDLEEVLVLLSKPQAACPVCESDLSGPRRTTVLAKQEARKAAFQAEKDQVKKLGIGAKKALTAAQEQGRLQNARLHELTAKRSQRDELAARREKLRAEIQDVKKLQTEVASLRTLIETENFAAPKRIQRQRLDKELERLGLAKQEYEAALLRVRQLEPMEQRYQELRHAESTLPQEVAERQRLERVVAEKRKECEAAQAQLEKFRGKLGQYADIRQRSDAAETLLGHIRGEVSALQIAEARYVDSMTRCDRALEEKKQRAETQRKASEESKLYQALMLAFGRKGVQALIIENAIPELEEEANELLARMTDNAMAVRFETTRSAKSSGNEIETLDIKITDDVGIRPYELFSGGESFRVNFAIRIALSRLLARRSGARLQTLIMDEGFGSQDGKGRERLIEVIESIKDDFEKILVITHFEEMKDAFAQRIEIVKGPDGSHIHLL